MKHIKLFNESVIRSYTKQQYDDYKIESLCKYSESDLIEIFSEITDEYDTEIKFRFFIQFPSQLMDMMKMTPEKCESYIESGLYPVIRMSILNISKDTKKIITEITESSSGLEDYKLYDIKTESISANYDDNLSNKYDTRIKAYFAFDPNASETIVSHSMSAKQIQGMLINHGILPKDYNISINKLFISSENKSWLAEQTISPIFKKGYKKLYTIDIDTSLQINFSTFNKIYNDKNSILKFCEEISNNSNIYNLKNSIDIDKSKKENIRFKIMFFEK